MVMKRFLFSIFEFVFQLGLASLVVYLTYRVQVISNIDFDEEVEIKKGNAAVGIMLAANMIASAMIIQKGFQPVLSLWRIHLLTHLQHGPDISHWRIIVYPMGQIFLVFILAALIIMFSLRVFGKLSSHMHLGKELRKGNVAVGILLGSVVLVMAFYVSDGVSALSRSMIPRVDIGRVQILE